MASERVQRIFLIVILVLVFFLPEAVSSGWHLVHGKSVAYRYWKVDVPFEWYAVSRGEGMSVERMVRIPWREGPVAVFDPVHFTKTYVFNYDLYGKEQKITLQGRGYQLLGQKDVSIADEDGRCWSFVSTASGSTHDMWIACVVPKDLTSIDYIGTAAYTDEFYSMLEKIRRLPAAK